MTVSQALLWKLSAGACLVRRWDDEVLVYHEASGATHYLNDAATLVWSALRERGAATVSQLAGQLPGNNRDGLVPVVEDALAHLRRLGLAEPCLA